MVVGWHPFRHAVKVNIAMRNNNARLVSRLYCVMIHRDPGDVSPVLDRHYSPDLTCS